MTVLQKAKIDFLMELEFGHVSKAPPPRNSNAYSQQKNQELMSKLALRKVELSSLHDDDLEVLYTQEYAKLIELTRQKYEQDERDCFYNQPSAGADFVYWSKMADWTLDEAIALSYGKNPKVVNWDSVRPVLQKFQFTPDYKTFVQVPRLADEYAQRRELALRAITWNKLYDPVLPSIFLSWAKELSLPLPEKLVSEVEKIGGTATNWRERYKELEKKYIAHLEKTVSEKNQISQSKQQPAETYTFDITSLLELTIKANVQFFSPRKSIDAKKGEVVEWIKAEGKKLNLEVSDNVAGSMFTIIKPTNHNPKKKRA